MPTGQSPIAHVGVVGDSEYPTSRNGTGRCTALARSGRRCANWARRNDPKRRCVKHGGSRSLETLRLQSRYGEFLTGDTLRDAYLRHLDDPDICDVRNELALQRTLLSGVLAKIDGVKTLTGLSGEAIAAITALNKAVAELALVQDRLITRSVHSVNINQLDWFVDQVVAVVSDHVEDHGTLADIADALEACVVHCHGGGPPFPYPFTERHLREAARSGDEGGGEGRLLPGGAVLREGGACDGAGDQPGQGWLFADLDGPGEASERGGGE